MPTHTEHRAHLIATVLSGASLLHSGHGGNYLWASYPADTEVPRLVQFARSLVDEILRQEQAANEGGRDE